MKYISTLVLSVIIVLLWSCKSVQAPDRLRGTWSTGIMDTEWGRAEHRLVFHANDDIELVSRYVDAGGLQAVQGKRTPCKGSGNGFTVRFKSPNFVLYCILCNNGKDITAKNDNEQFLFHRIQ